MKITRFFVFCCLSSVFVFMIVYPVFASAPTTEKIAFSSDQDGDYEIYIMNPDGSGQTNLTRNKSVDVHPTWSPTGQQILFVSNRDGVSDLYLMDADGANVQKVFKDSKLRFAPAWSPDGKRISYCRTGAVRELYIASLDKKNEERIAPVGRFDGYSSWSADGTKIVFGAPLRQGNTSSRIHIFNLATREKEVLFGEVIGASMMAPTWSPSDDKIAFTWFQGGTSAIYIMESDGSSRKRVVDPPRGFETAHPEWSPSGNTLVYEQYEQGNNDRHIYTVDLNGGDPEKLTRKGINFFADWFDPVFALPVSPQPHLLTTVWSKMKTRD